MADLTPERDTAGNTGCPCRPGAQPVRRACRGAVPDLQLRFPKKYAAQAAKRFSGEEEGNVLRRFSNPTVSMFEERLAALEGAEDCVATASGVSAIMAVMGGASQAGDHIVASNSLFGATVQLFNNILSRTGITTTFVSHTDPAAGKRRSVRKPNCSFPETPSNPLTEIADIGAGGHCARQGHSWSRR